MRRTLLLAAAACAAVTSAGPASAACYGTANIGVVCHNGSLTGGTLYSDCVYLGSGPCTPVSVPGPQDFCVSGGGPNWELATWCVG